MSVRGVSVSARDVAMSVRGVPVPVRGVDVPAQGVAAPAQGFAVIAHAPSQRSTARLEPSFRRCLISFIACEAVALEPVVEHLLGETEEPADSPTPHDGSLPMESPRASKGVFMLQSRSLVRVLAC